MKLEEHSNGDVVATKLVHGSPSSAVLGDVMNQHGSLRIVRVFGQEFSGGLLKCLTRSLTNRHSRELSNPMLTVACLYITMSYELTPTPTSPMQAKLSALLCSSLTQSARA